MREERYNRKINKKITKVVIIIFAILVIFAVIFARTSFFTVKTIQVEGNRYYTEKEILILGNCKPGGNLFFDKNISQIKSRLINDPYISNVKIRRKLPDTLIIEVEELIQGAAFKYGDKYLVVSEDGMVVKTVDSPPQITLVDGLTLSRIEQGQMIEAEETVLLKQTLNILSASAEFDMYFMEIYPSEDIFRTRIFGDLYCVGTPEEICKSIKESKLQAVVKKLIDDDISHGTISVSGENAISYSPEVPE